MPLRLPANYAALSVSPRDATPDELAAYERWLVGELALTRAALRSPAAARGSVRDRVRAALLDGPLTAKQIALRLRVDAGQVARVLRVGGWFSRTVPDDRRSAWMLTQAGREAREADERQAA